MPNPDLEGWHTVAISWDTNPSDKVEFHFLAEDGHHRQTLRLLPDGASEVVSDVVTPFAELGDL